MVVVIRRATFITKLKRKSVLFAKTSNIARGSVNVRIAKNRFVEAARGVKVRCLCCNSCMTFLFCTDRDRIREWVQGSVCDRGFQALIDLPLPNPNLSGLQLLIP